MRKIFTPLIILFFVAIVFAKVEAAETLKSHSIQLGITVNNLNPYTAARPLTEISMPPEIGVSIWFFDHFGCDLTFAFSAGLDDSYSTTYYGSTHDGSFNYQPSSSYDYTDITNSKFSVSLVPKMKLIKNKNSYLYVGLPIMFNPGYEQDDGEIYTSYTYTNSNTPTVYVSRKDIRTEIDKDTYTSYLGLGLLIGGAFQFESLPGVELSFCIGVSYSILPRERETQQSRSLQTITYDASGTELTNDYYPFAPNQTVIDDTRDKEYDGFSTFANGEGIISLAITYYFLTI